MHDVPDFGAAFDSDLVRQLISIFEAMADGVWVCDATPRLIWINSACERLNKIKREDVCGRPVDELLEIGMHETMKTLKMDGIEKVFKGLTDFGEVLKVCL